MKTKHKLLFILPLLPFAAQAIVTEDTARSESNPTNYAVYSSFDWDHVVRVGGSSGVAVSPYWILTAGHVGAGNISYKGVPYTFMESITHPEADLRLIRYDKAFDGWYSIYTGTLSTFPQNKKSTGLMIGYGRSGNVLSDTTYEWNGSETVGIRRWGDSLIDGTGSQSGIGDYIVLNFDRTATTYAAGAADKDSGGGVFVAQEGTWYLAGTLVTVTGTSGAYTGSVAVDLRSYASWISSVVVETNDLDADGIPNGWEWQFGSITGVVAEADQDDDGFSGMEEYIADTDPTDASGFFKIDAFAASTNQSVTFTGSTERFYQLYYATNSLTDVGLAWTPVYPDWIPGSGSNMTLSATNHAETTFYRLYVKP